MEGNNPGTMDESHEHEGQRPGDSADTSRDRAWKGLLDQTPRRGMEVGVGELRGFLQITRKW